MKAFWYRDENFGDALTPWLIDKITGSQPEYSSGDLLEPVHVVTGSILNIQVDGAVVWGAGLARCTDPVPEKVKIRAVRGPRTREKVIAQGVECPAIFGDPAILLPRFLEGRSEKLYDLAIIPHCADYSDVEKAYGSLPFASVVRLADSVESVISQITACRVAISSSLHGIIAAHAYGIPCAWVEFSDKVGGCGFKFHDYFASGGLPLVNPINLRSMPTDILSVAGRISTRMPEIDADALYAACPFKP